MRALKLVLVAVIWACSAPAASSPRPTNAEIAAGTALWAVSFVDDRTGWVIAAKNEGHGLVLGTSDGGTSWATLASLDIFPAGGLTQLRFVDARNGWLLTSLLLPGNVGGCAPPSTAPPQCRTVIFRTSDGGRTWREQLSVEEPSKLGPGLRGLTAVDERHAWAIRLATRSASCGPFNCNLEVVGTNDGEHWGSVATLPAFSDQLRFVDALRGWATTYTAKNEAGRPTNTATILATYDGGRTWTPQLSIDGPDPSLQVDFTDARTGWALGFATADCAGTMCTRYSLYQTTDGGQSWEKLQDGTPPTAWWSPRNNVSLLGAPRFAGASSGWIPIVYDGTSSDGVLLTIDRGRTWTRTRPPSTTEVWDVHDLAASGASAWVVGERIEDEVWFVARSDRGAPWMYELTVSR